MSTLTTTSDFLLPATSGAATLDVRVDAASDHLLLEATCEGNEAAFAEIVNRYRNQITNYIYRLLNDYDLAVDLAQETFIRVYRARERYHAGYAFSTYIYRIATNLAISEMRCRKRRRFISLSTFFAARDNHQEIESFALNLVDTNPLQDETIIVRERQFAVQRAIATLPETYRVPLVLRDIEERPYEEIAALLALNIGTVKSRISRARSLLREKLDAYL